MHRIYYNNYDAIVIDEKRKTYFFTSRQKGIVYAEHLGVNAIWRPALNQREEFLIEVGYRKVASYEC